jgi:Cu+-exporting ATPase
MAGEWLFHWHARPWFGWLGFALILPVQLFAGARFYRGAWQQLKIGHSNMDTLVSLGSTAAFGFSVYGLFTGMSHLYFMEAGAIITLISIGHYLEARVGEKAAVAVKSLLKLAPESASRLKADGSRETVSVGALAAGDQVFISPGDRIPTDGIVAKGRGAVDESMLTGESVPVEKTEEALLYAGTVNQDGALVMRVTATGGETALARIIKIVEHAQTSRAGIERLADRVSSVFVPIVILIAIGTLLGWGILGGNWHAGIINAVGVLIVACPCAMGLATPAAIMAGANSAARRGILIRDGTALEKCGTITAVLFDKTGTLTLGKPQVGRVLDFGAPENEFASLALALAAPSKHPYSRALADYFSTASCVEVSDWSEVRGSGVAANFAGETVRLGSLKWLSECGVPIEAVPPDSDGTAIGLSRGKKLVGVAVLVDAPKPHAKEVIAQIIRGGFQVYLVSGDAARTVQSVGIAAGIPPENIHSEIPPGDKAGIVEALQKKGGRIAFVGDGINDAPALAQADLGIAVMQASDVASEAADILLLKSDIEAIPEALGLSAATLRTIRQNLFWAFFYNIAAIPLASAGWMSPVFCAGAMALSDLFVIGNALRLLRWKSRFA